MGPRAVDFEANGAAPVEPVQLADNPDTWLGFTDLVFVDPVATGYSRSVAGTEEADRAFFGVEKDADAMADFVRLYLTRAGRCWRRCSWWARATAASAPGCRRQAPLRRHCRKGRC